MKSPDCNWIKQGYRRHKLKNKIIFDFFIWRIFNLSPNFIWRIFNLENFSFVIKLRDKLMVGI